MRLGSAAQRGRWGRRILARALWLLAPLGLLATAAFWGRAIHTVATTPPPEQGFVWFGPDGQPAGRDFHDGHIGLLVGDAIWHLYSTSAERWRGPGQRRSLWLGRTRPQEGRRDIRWSLPADGAGGPLVPIGFWPLPSGAFLLATHDREVAVLLPEPQRSARYVETTDIYRVSPEGEVFRFPQLTGRLLALMVVGDRVEAVLSEAKEVSRQARVVWAPLQGGAWSGADLLAVPEHLIGEMSRAAARRVEDASVPPERAWTVWGVFWPRVDLPFGGEAPWAIWRLRPGEPWVQTQMIERRPGEVHHGENVSLSREPAGGIHLGAVLQKASRYVLRGDTWVRYLDTPEAQRRGEASGGGGQFGTILRLTPDGLEPAELRPILRWVERADGWALQRSAPKTPTAPDTQAGSEAPSAMEARLPVAASPSPAVNAVQAGPAVVARWPGEYPEAVIADGEGGYWVLPNVATWIHVDATLARVDVSPLGRRIHRWWYSMAGLWVSQVGGDEPAEAFAQVGFFGVLGDLEFRRPARAWWFLALHLALFGLPVLLLLVAWPRRLRRWAWPVVTATWAAAVGWRLAEVWEWLGSGYL